MIKNKLYGSTERIPVEGHYVTITEKIDGETLCIFKKDDTIYYAQRNCMMQKNQLEREATYPGLIEWANEHHTYFVENLHEGSVICGEWISKGNIVYPKDEFPNPFIMFAKANITKQYTLDKVLYEHDKFIHPFIDKIIPEFISVVPVVVRARILPNKVDLDALYEVYTDDVGRDVEGFVVEVFNNISKYVRMKRGKKQEYKDNFRRKE